MLYCKFPILDKCKSAINLLGPKIY